MSPANVQLDAQGNLKHFLTVDGLSRELLTEILDKTEGFLGVAEQAVKKVPLCRGKIVANLFFETSTRTRTTFELAAKRLSADVLNLNISTSPPPRARPCSTPCATWRPCTWTCSWCATPTAAPPTSSPRMPTPTSASSTPATAATPTPPRRCWTCSPSAGTRGLRPTVRGRGGRRPALPGGALPDSWR